MRRLVSTGLLALVVALFTACADQETESPAEPQLKKVDSGCTVPLLGEKETILEEIDDLFVDRKSKRGAGQIVDNIARKVCAASPQYSDALNMAWDFAHLVRRQMPDKLLGDAEDSAALTNLVFAFAAEPGNPPLEIPDGAYEETGGIIQFDAGDASPEFPIVAATNNGEAAVVVDNPYAFGPTMPTVTIALSRELDDVVELPGGFIPGFVAEPEGYRIFSSHEPSVDGGGVLIALCQLEEFPYKVIGHLHEGTVELLVPSDPNPEDEGYIYCADASPYLGTGGLAGTPGWLNFALQLAQPAVQLFNPKSLHAMYFGKRGLGGRTTSLSSDAPVIPDIEVGESAQLTVGDPDASWTVDAGSTHIAFVDADGVVTGLVPGIATINATLDLNGNQLTWPIFVNVIEATVVHSNVLVFSRGQDDATEIYTLDGASALTQLTSNAVRDFVPSWSPDGSRIVFSRAVGSVPAETDYDLWTMNEDGSGQANLTQTPGSFEAGSDWTANGDRIVFSRGVGSFVPRDLWIRNSNGSEVQLTADPADEFGAAWSPDGTKIAYVSNNVDGDYEIYVMEVAVGTPSQLTDNSVSDNAPDWSPDGSLITYASGTVGVNFDIWVMSSVDGTGKTNLTNSATVDYAPDWSPDGLEIAYERYPVSGVNSADIWKMAADGSGQVGVLVGPEDDRSPGWQPAYMLTVEGAGSISGSVIGPGIRCSYESTTQETSGFCTTKVQPGQTVLLRATSSGGVFWSENCTGGDEIGTCLVTITGSTTVTATFFYEAPV